MKTHRRIVRALYLIIAAFTVFCVQPCYFSGLQVSAQEAGQITKVGTTASQFLKVDVTPRGASLGAAFVAVANDVSALYWNAAGLSRLTQREVVIAHTDWIAGVSFDYGGVVIPLGGFGALGASVTSLNMGDMEVRTVDQPEGTGERFDAGDLAVGVSYARNLTDQFSVGLTAKYIREFIWHMNASTFAIDVGTLYRTSFHGLAIGMSISNFGGKMKFGGRDGIIYFNVNPGKAGTNDKVVADIRTDGWALPLMFRVGLAAEPVISPAHHVTVAVEALHPNDNTESVNVGIEYVMNNLIALRTGYRSLFRRDSEEGLTLGAGVNYTMKSTTLKVDYAWGDFGRLKDVQRFALGIEF